MCQVLTRMKRERLNYADEFGGRREVNMVYQRAVLYSSYYLSGNAGGSVLSVQMSRAYRYQFS